MADTKISALTAATSLTDDDLFVVVDDPGGTPVTKKITRANALGSLAAKSQVWGMSASVIGTLVDGTYTLALKMPYGVTITEATTKCASGTATATFKINTTALGGTANSVSSSEQSQSHASANAVSAGDDINVTISSASSLTNPVFTLSGTRAFS